MPHREKSAETSASADIKRADLSPTPAPVEKKDVSIGTSVINENIITQKELE